MAKTHVVKQGEHLSSIAAENGFVNFEVIWNHPNNAALKAVRDPHTLFPGDKLFIPDRQEKIASGATTQVHTFTLDISTLLLRLSLLDLDNQPLGNAPCDLSVESKAVVSKSTDKKGFVVPDEEIDKSARKATLVVHIQKPPAKKGDPPPPEQKLEFDLKIGDLNPEKKLSGQQARLNNLGYFAGFALNDLEQLLWAAEEFKCDKINRSQARVTTRPKLVGVRPEDQKNGEELGDPLRETGIQDRDIRDTLKKKHGS